VKRALKPRATEAIAVSPIAITDRTAPRDVGLEAREFRALVRCLQIPHVVAGRRLIVDAQTFRDALAVAARSSGTVDPSTVGEAPPISGGLLRRLGRVREAGCVR
jgi:hypothetical protein